MRMNSPILFQDCYEWFLFHLPIAELYVNLEHSLENQYDIVLAEIWANFS